MSYKLTTEEFINQSKQKFGNKFDYRETVYTGKENYLTVNCPIHGRLSMKKAEHLGLSTGCHRCENIKRSKEKYDLYMAQARAVHGDKYDYSKIVLTENFNKVDRVTIICPKHGEFKTDLVHHIYFKNNCYKCAKENSKVTLDAFIKRSNILYNNQYDYSRVKFNTLADKVEIVCKKHGPFIQRANSHLMGNRCKECFLEGQILSKETFIENAKNIHGNVYDYSKVVYLGNKKKVELICKTHGSFWLAPNSHLSNKVGCARCRESYGEKLVARFLSNSKIKFGREVKIKGYTYRFDFYLPEQKIYIEYNGIQHYKPVDQFGGLKSFLKGQENDKRKKELVKNLKSFFITVDYTRYSYKSVKKYLIHRFKLIYKYWFLVNGEVVVFKNPLDVYRYFNIDADVLVRDLVDEVLKKHSNVKILF